MGRSKRILLLVVPSMLIVAATWVVLTRPSQTAPAGAPVERRAEASKPAPGEAAPTPSVDMAGATAPSPDGFLDTDGLRVAAFIDKLAPHARRGDVKAAMRVYRAERFCSLIDLTARRSPPQDDEGRAKLAESQARCEGVTPAQLRERMAFLDQGVRAGLEEALLAYRQEGPDGLPIGELDPNDPRLVAWKQTANDYLRTLAAQGNHLAWTMLAQDYETGLVAPVDLHASLMYWSAFESARDPDRDPLAVPFVADLAKQLPPDDAQLALRQGLDLARRFPFVRKKA
jgi:hypothetical protein